MMRLLGWGLAGLLLGGIVHLATILLLPRTATQDAYARLTPLTAINRMALLPTPAAESTLLPFMDPAFAVAVCRYDLGGGPLKLQAPVSQPYTSVSFYTRRDIAYYAINDRAAGRRTIELDLMTAEQRADLQSDEEMTAADRLIVTSPTPTGLIVVRGFAPEPGAMPLVRGILNTATCARTAE
jgi:uncharacterized membrane protein